MEKEKVEQNKISPKFLSPLGASSLSSRVYIQIPAWHLHCVSVCVRDVQAELHFSSHLLFVTATVSHGFMHEEFRQGSARWFVCFMMSGASAGMAQTSGDDGPRA